ncbi:MAG: EFR1 family ferrodoxin [Lachnospiraceae bacterium]|nr:EFR1 family ferrodoxin [Lachnospiraceae bacterium]
MERRIYYFTGTGNSMRAARIIAERLGNTEIVSMRADPSEYTAKNCEIVGFVYPVYHWTMPAPAVSFVEKLDINPKAYVFVVAMPSFVCGIACERLAGILERKGIRLQYGNIVNSVANYVIVYPPFPSPKLRVPKTEKKLRKIAEDIFARKMRDYPRASRMIRRKRERVMTPYLELQKYADNPFAISEDCISCGLCSRVCPCHNIVLEGGKPSFRHHCANCMACVTSCPKRAIGYEITEGDRKLLDASNSGTPLVKIMRLPPKRKLYRNPYITVNDLTKESELWPKEAKQEK